MYRPIRYYYYYYINRTKSTQTEYFGHVMRQSSASLEMGQRQTTVKTRSSAQLPQRDSASATHVFLGSVTNHVVHWTPHLFYNYIINKRLAKVVSTLSANKPCDIRGWWSFQTLYTFKVICLCIIRKPLRAFIIHYERPHISKISDRRCCIMWIITKFSCSTPVRRPLCSAVNPAKIRTNPIDLKSQFVRHIVVAHS